LRTSVSDSLRVTSSYLRLGLSRLEEPIELAEPLNAAVDVNDVHVVKPAVEDSGGEDLIAGEDLGPILTCLLGGKDDSTALAA
jgi:hypothetical protein